MREVETVDDVVAELGGARRIGVDGADGAGKSTLADRLSEVLAMPVFHLDHFLEKNQGGFVEHIKYDELGSAIRQHSSFVIDGVCLREVLRRAGISVDAFVYVKRYYRGLWSEEREFEIDEPLEDFLAKERELCSRIAGEKVEHLGVGEEIIRYHSQYRPHLHANVVFRRNDS
jgi:shikimate kinase